MLKMTCDEAYAGLIVADRRGDFHAVLTLSALLIRGFETGKGVQGFPLDRIGVVVEIEAKARRMYQDYYEQQHDQQRILTTHTAPDTH